MELNKLDFEVLDKAAAEYFKEGKISTRCHRCGGKITCIEYGNSYEVRCETDDCISERARGI